ncbi:hypothetical protein CaCOL14_006519 [Colletotrichum acutatum]
MGKWTTGEKGTADDRGGFGRVSAARSHSFCDAAQRFTMQSHDVHERVLANDCSLSMPSMPKTTSYCGLRIPAEHDVYSRIIYLVLIKSKHPRRKRGVTGKKRKDRKEPKKRGE